MTRWTGVVAAGARPELDGMASRLAAHLHPVCGRPLVWHSVSALFAADPAPDRVLVVGDPELPDDLFHDLPGEVEILRHDGVPASAPGVGRRLVLLVAATAVLPPACISELLSAPEGACIATRDGAVAAARSTGPPPDDALESPRGPRIEAGRGVVVRDRAGLAVATREVRDRLVRQLMRGGVTFILPDSVSVDVDVRIGRDAVVYPGAIMEGQTTIGDETVIGPGCRIISSWIGSGVEMKGWNYIAHTSIRNRAILEPYVRRGFD